jgi:hypothetical protein
VSPEVTARLAQIKQKSVDGTATLEDYKEAVTLMRGDRQGAAMASETSRRSKAKAAVPSADSMLDELGS